MLGIITSVVLVGGMSFGVRADEATLSSLKVQAKNSAGELKDVKLTPAFSPDVTEYSATVRNDVISLVLDPKTTEDNAEAKTDWEALDVGDNTSFVKVTAADGTTKEYTIKTKRLTEEEDATYKDDSGEDETTAKSKSTSSKDSTIKVDGAKMKITENFKKSDIPEGFSKSTYKYKGKKYASIKGDRKDLIALWLEPVNEESTDENETTAADESKSSSGFYIYDKDAKSFYAMNNIYIKSRMYTIVNNSKPDKFLSDYETNEVTIIDRKVKAWVLDEANSLYLVYAMNWDGQTNLYCYDDVEKCFQRYIVDSAAANQLEAANKSINKLQDKNNELVKKYNSSNSTKWKIIAVLLVVIIILFFVCLNLALKSKEKKILETEDGDADEVPEKRDKEEFFEEKEQDTDDEDEDELFTLIEEDDEDEDDFVMLDSKYENKGSDVQENNVNDGFDINTDEIDISAQVMKEMEEEGIKADSNKKSADSPKSFNAQKEEPFNEESLNDILSTAFPSEDSDDDGFTFL